MTYYLSKYVGTYRVKAEVDLSTNDFCRDAHGNLNNNNDIYIKCASNIRIYHYGGNVLEVYIPSIQKGRNILRQFCYENGIGEVTKEINNDRVVYKTSITIDKLIKLIEKDSTIFDIIENDSEILFKIKDKDLSKIINMLKPQTSGVSISPFSPKNLHKEKYEYTTAQIELYEKITSVVPKENKLIIGRINNDFFIDIMTKKLGKNTDEIKFQMKNVQLKLKDYIYYIGLEDDYISYLKDQIDKRLNLTN